MGRQLACARGDVVRVGYIGSYAGGDWGFGSDVDLILVVEDSALPFAQRALEFDATRLPVPADLLVYTRREWADRDRDRRFWRTVEREVVWTYPSGAGERSE